jgi:hypothetical protein
MRLVIDGRPNKLIADALHISVRTVEVHRARVFDKMNVKSAVELANLLRAGSARLRCCSQTARPQRPARSSAAIAPCAWSTTTISFAARSALTGKNVGCTCIGTPQVAGKAPQLHQPVGLALRGPLGQGQAAGNGEDPAIVHRTHRHRGAGVVQQLRKACVAEVDPGRDGGEVVVDVHPVVSSGSGWRLTLSCPPMIDKAVSAPAFGAGPSP